MQAGRAAGDDGGDHAVQAVDAAENKGDVKGERRAIQNGPGGGIVRGVDDEVAPRGQADGGIGGDPFVERPAASLDQTEMPSAAIAKP